MMDLEGSMAANAASEEAFRATLKPKQRASLERFDAESALDLANDYLARVQALRDDREYLMAEMTELINDAEDTVTIEVALMCTALALLDR